MQTEGVGDESVLQPLQGEEQGRENAIRLFEQFLDGSPRAHPASPFTDGQEISVPLRIDPVVSMLTRSFGSFWSCTRVHSTRNAATQRAPTADELNLLARHRQEPPSDEGSSADEGVPKKNSGWVGAGPSLQVGVGYTSRDYCDGQGRCITGALAH